MKFPYLQVYRSYPSLPLALPLFLASGKRDFLCGSTDCIAVYRSYRCLEGIDSRMSFYSC
jgi:hypothetical protein